MSMLTSRVFSSLSSKVPYHEVPPVKLKMTTLELVSPKKALALGFKPSQISDNCHISYHISQVSSVTTTLDSATFWVSCVSSGPQVADDQVAWRYPWVMEYLQNQIIRLSIQGGTPPVISWFINHSKYRYNLLINPSGPSEIVLINQLSYLWGTTLYLETADLGIRHCKKPPIFQKIEVIYCTEASLVDGGFPQVSHQIHPQSLVDFPFFSSCPSNDQRTIRN